MLCTHAVYRLISVAKLLTNPSGSPDTTLLPFVVITSPFSLSQITRVGIPEINNKTIITTNTLTAAKDDQYPHSC